MSKQALIDELKASRNQLYTVLRPIDEAALKEPNAVGGYSVVELCGLISVRENRLLTIMQQVSQGDIIKMDSDDAFDVQVNFCATMASENVTFNAVQARKRQQWPWREILQELVWVREETGWTLANMAESVLFHYRAIDIPEHRHVQLCPADIVRRLIAQDHSCAEAIHHWWAGRAS
jgi:hypothetical protein